MESMVKKLKRKLRSSRKKKEEKLFLEKGGIFLKKLIADCNGKSISIRNFSSSQIRKATNNFDYRCLLHWSWDQEWYKGIVEDKPYLIKKFSTYEDDEYVFSDIVLSARMSNHNNFLKLIGCCFEFSPAVVVFEYEELASLYEKGRVFSRESKVLTWSVRLKIAKEIAVAVTYLHTAFPRIIIHKTINPTKIFLDKNWKAKLIDFRFSVSLPQGKSKIQDVKVSGMYVYTDPLYYDTRSVSEYTDVYSFGLCLLVFLTARPPHDSFEPDVHMYTDPRSMISYVKGLYENGKLDEVIDQMIVKDNTSIQRLQVEAFLVMALRCCEEREEDRPKMIQVAKELKRIEQIEHPASSAI